MTDRSVQASAFFCEDVRDEVTGMHSVIGVFPDHIHLTAGAGILPKLTVYVRLLIPAGEPVGELAVIVLGLGGEELAVSHPDETLVQKIQSDAKTLGVEYGGLNTRFAISPFKVPQEGSLVVQLREGGAVREIGRLKISLGQRSA